MLEKKHSALGLE